MPLRNSIPSMASGTLLRGPAASCKFFLASGCVGTSSTNLPESLQCQNRPVLLRATPMSFSVWLGIP